MGILDWLYKLLRWTLGSIFIYAGGIKLLEPKIFAALIGAYGIVPDSLLMPVAVALPLLEVSAGIGLLFDVRGSLALLTGLLVLFIIVLGYGIWMGLDVDCGCFGPEDPEAKALHGLNLSLYRDLVMLAVIGILYGRRWSRARKPVAIRTAEKELSNKRRKEDAYA